MRIMQGFLKNITVWCLALIMVLGTAFPAFGADTEEQAQPAAAVQDGAEADAQGESAGENACENPDTSGEGEEPPKKAADPKIGILNSAADSLSPTNPRSAELNAYLDELLPTIIDDEMDIYQQVKACYDYVKSNTRYGSHVANLGAMIGTAESGMTTCRSIDRKYGAVEGFGAVALAAKVGMCNAYASAFILMARKIGLDAYLVKGYTKSAGGGYAYHEWCEINIDGAVYVFDPQLDQSLKRGGLKEYIVFCASYDQIPGRYSKV